jgi:rod shape determining protein RodA
MAIKFISPLSIWKNTKLDRTLLVALLVILIISLIAQSSVSQGHFFSKQLLYILLGIPIFFFGYSLPTETIRKVSWFVYGFSIILLLWVLVKGTSALGAQRWISIGGFSLQPSEPAKIASIIALANWYSLHKPKSILDIIISGCAILLLPFGLIFIQPDLGTSMVLIAIFFSMTYWAGSKIAQVIALISPLPIAIASALGAKAFSFPAFDLGKHHIEPGCSVLGVVCILAIAVYLAMNYQVFKSRWRSVGLIAFVLFSFFVGIIGRPIAWGILEPYQQKRLTIFMDPQIDPLGSGYNIIQSLLAVGSGDLIGQGYKQGRLTQGQFVPEQHTDFVFSSVAEEWGFAGTMLLLLVFGVICFRIFSLVRNLDDGFGKLIAVGILTFLSFHVFVNIGMNIGLMPVTGVPLPFISYGGTALWVCLFSLGIVQRIYADNFGNSMFK